MCCAVLSCVQLFVAPQTVARRSPCSSSFPGKNTGVGCHFLCQGIFPGIKPVSPALTTDSLPPCTWGAQMYMCIHNNIAIKGYLKWCFRYQ